MALRLNGSTSGYVELDAPAVAGTTALTLPATSGTVATQAYVDTAEADAIAAGGLQLITAQTFSAVSSISVDNCFTATYQNYLIVLEALPSANQNINLRLRASGSDASGSNYDYQILTSYSTTVQGARESDTSFFRVMWNPETDGTLVTLTVSRPNLAVTTKFHSYGGSNNEVNLIGGDHDLTTAYDGVTFLTSSGTMTGTLRIYGYKD
jgi:hypothetical protein